MNDRELLESAAKAAGISLCRWIDHCGYLVEGDEIWNPLVDDGDALLLAVALGANDHFSIEIMKDGAQTMSFEPFEHCEYEKHQGDPYASTRRAIVRTAAAIGKEMK